jgi:phosphatidylserine synthase
MAAWLVHAYTAGGLLCAFLATRATVDGDHRLALLWLWLQVVIVNAAVLCALAGLVVVPIRYIYPSRSPILQRWTNGLGAVWAVLVLALPWTYSEVPGGLLWASWIVPLHYIGLSLLLEGRRRGWLPA